MKVSAILTAASLVAAVAGGSGSCRAAAEGRTPASLLQPAAAVLKILAGAAVPAAELGQERARGISVDVNGSAVNNGTSASNAVLGSPITGTISNDHSIDNDVGITSVLQNFGNNSVIQTSTTINITVH
jgi:hypothetical protein